MEGWDPLMSDAQEHEPVEAEPAREEQRDDGATATQTRPEAESDDQVRKLPPWKLVLHNDDVNAMEDVIEAIVEITPLSLEVAIRRMLEAHSRGRSLLLTTHRELAELYRDRFKARQLTTTLEPGD